jgi:hypothetical protein
MSQLNILEGPDAGKSFPLDKGQVSIGTQDTDVLLTDAQVAEQHAHLTKDGDAVLVTDLGSPGGTLVNGHRVRSLPLEPGDQIRVGDTLIQYQADSEPAEAVPSPSQEEAHAAPQPSPEADAEPIPVRMVDDSEGPEEPPSGEAAEQAPAQPAEPTQGGEPPAPAAPAPANEPAQPAAASAPPPQPAKAPPQPTQAPRGNRVRGGQRLRSIRYGRPLVKKITCPNCWHQFVPESVLFIAKHPELNRDPVAGAGEYLRFAPERFTVEGEALDARGLPSSDLACPRCHLRLPQAALEVPPVFISVVGSPASGKSYFLTSMTWELRRRLPRFGLAFQDADPVANSVVRESEMRLFRNANPEELTEIPKTQQDDPRLHKTVHLNGVDIRHPIPFQFFLTPTPKHPHHAEVGRIGRTVVLYDNAGEDCLPREDAVESAATRHLARSNIVFLVYDPTQDPEFRARCPSDDPQLSGALRPDAERESLPYTQGTIANELAVRIRRWHHMPLDKRLKKPLIVIVAKFDIWGDMAGVSIEEEPMVAGDNGSPARLDLGRIERTSDALREFLETLCPDFVAIADGISEFVRFIPVTSLGHSPVIVKKDGATPFYGIRPRDMRPRWVTIPFLYCLSRWGPRGIVQFTNGTS